VALVYFSVLATLLIVPSTLAPVAIEQAKGLAGYLINIERQMEAALSQPVIFLGQPLQLGQLLAEFLKSTTDLLNPEVESALSVLETTSISLAWVLIILVSTYYFLLDWERLRDWFIRLAPDEIQPDVRQLLHEMNLVWQAYLHGTFVLMVVVAIVFTLVWLAVGLPGAIILGLLTGLLTIIPEIGPAVAAILAVLVAFFQGSDFLPISNFWFALLIFAIYFVLIQIKVIWLRPRIMKRFLHLNEGLIFVAIIAATVLWGILGALLIIPMLSTAGILGRYLRSRLLHQEPWPVTAPATIPAIQVELDQESPPTDTVEVFDQVVPTR
jgi:predicted PurR-regulated permease PerM